MHSMHTPQDSASRRRLVWVRLRLDDKAGQGIPERVVVELAKAVDQRKR